MKTAEEIKKDIINIEQEIDFHNSLYSAFEINEKDYKEIISELNKTLKQLEFQLRQSLLS